MIEIRQRRAQEKGRVLQMNVTAGEKKTQMTWLTIRTKFSSAESGEEKEMKLER